MDVSTFQLVTMLGAIMVIAFLYSSVGHGGATGYLAAMSLLGIAPTLARPGALWMNCFVAFVAFWRFHRAGYFDWSLFTPLAAASIPMAWLGSWLHLEGWTYSLLLAAALCAAGVLLSRNTRSEEPSECRRIKLPLALTVGGALGFLAGLTGIGGGVYLTPLLVFLRWTPVKTAGGISALFIVVNSVSGLVGLGREALIWEPLFLGAPIVGITAALGATAMSVYRWNNLAFRRALACVLWIAASKNVLVVLN